MGRREAMNLERALLGGPKQVGTVDYVDNKKEKNSILSRPRVDWGREEGGRWL